MQNPKLVPLAILHEADGDTVEGITKFQKLVFMAQRQKDSIPSDAYNFEPHKYGPFSKELYGDIDELVENGFIEKTSETTSGGNEKEVFTITDEGKKMLDWLRYKYDEGVSSEEIQDIVANYNKMPLLQLIKRVYSEYPEMAVNSELEIL